jgi:hypothetical protein
MRLPDLRVILAPTLNTRLLTGLYSPLQIQFWNAWENAMGTCWNLLTCGLPARLEPAGTCWPIGTSAATPASPEIKREMGSRPIRE